MGPFKLMLNLIAVIVIAAIVFIPAAFIVEMFFGSILLLMDHFK